ncbi:MAG: efflux RND transporter periplasmic adaptor subunit [Bacteroidales bacterium]
MKLSGNFSLHILLIQIFILQFACTGKDESKESTENEGLIAISDKQFESEGMALGNLQTVDFEEIIKINGIIKAHPKGIAIVSSHISGLVSNISCSIGNYVKLGQVLCSLSSKELIVLQQEFAETSAILKKLELDFQRAKVLNDEKIGSQKEYISIESEFKSTLAKYEGLKSQLKLLNINTQKVEGGTIFSSIPMYAPISGYITAQNCVSGQYLESNVALFEIVDINQLQLELAVYEKDLSLLKSGQKVRYYNLNDRNKIFLAELISIGKSIDPETKSIPCIARINSEDCKNFVNQMFVEAIIITNQYKAPAVNSEAIAKAGEELFVFTQEKVSNNIHYLKKNKIKTGNVSNGFTEILSDEKLENIVIKGIYNIPVD